ncbi:hypothetical protein BOX15_Mlig033871g1 [Macrostomum lignano]|uniref:Uncharacterized protein n=1 Tax=Macrostomum lignano TaxID=282301 RepID=A0A267GAF6_9PLAT|nr:hypothetical protein BOX15_Mlig033871g1 [Macrostomum lignano]
MHRYQLDQHESEQQGSRSRSGRLDSLSVIKVLILVMLVVAGIVTLVVVASVADSESASASNFLEELPFDQRSTVSNTDHAPAAS